MDARRGPPEPVRCDARPADARGRRPAQWDSSMKPRQGVGLLPPETKEYGAEFFRLVFDRAEFLGYMEDGRLHISILRRFCVRMSDCLGSQDIMLDPHEVFRDYDSFMISWDYMRQAFEEHYRCEVGAHRKFNVVISLNGYERINQIMNGDANSYLGVFYGLFTFVMILSSVAAVLSPSLQGRGLQGMVVVFFSLDYLVKLLCAPHVRVMVDDTKTLLLKVVPDPTARELETPAKRTRFSRTVLFLSAPINILDLVSVVPFWVDMLFTKTNLKFGILRALRILRVFRMVKGSLSDTMTILGDTLRRSQEALVVMVLWTTVLSVLIGCVLQELEPGGRASDDGEHEPWSFDFVPTSCVWVFGRLVNMHGSLIEKYHIPEEEASFALVIFVGICKGCVCIVPVGVMAAAFKASDQAFQRQRRIRAQIRRESSTPLGMDWVQDHQSPSAEIELREATGGLLAGIGSFNIPILEPTGLTCTICVHIDSKTMHGLFSPTRPEVTLTVSWEPDGDFRSGVHDRPAGTLTLTLENGAGFLGNAGQQWKALFRVPVRIRGSDTVEKWMTGPSDRGAPEPSWQTSKAFNIEWEDGGVSRVSQSVKQALKRKNLLKRLKDRSASINSLELMVNKL